MKKRVLVYISFVFSFLLFLFYEFCAFSFYNMDAINDGRVVVTAHAPESMTNAEFIETLKQIAADSGSDILISVQNPNESIYYTTNTVPSALRLHVEGGNTAIEPGEKLSVYKEDKSRLLYSFSWFGDRMTIYPVEESQSLDISIVSLLVEYQHMEEIFEGLNKAAIQVSTEVGESVGNDMSSLLFVIGSAFFFFFITMIYYSFTRRNDIAVKKSHGYSNRDIVLCELRICMPVFLLCAAVMLLVVFVCLGIIFEFSSSLFFCSVILPKVLFILLVTMVLLVLAFWFNSGRSMAEDIKGKSSCKDLFRFVCAVKTIVFIILTINLTQMLPSVMEAYNGYRMISVNAGKLEGYYKTTSYTLLEDPDKDMDVYRERIEGFYQKLHEDYGCILASGLGERVEGFEGRLSITVNDNFVEFCDIYDFEGNKILASELPSDRLTILFPEENSYDYERISKICRNYYHIEMSEVNIQYYDADISRMFSFDITDCEENNGYYTDVIIIVTSPVEVDPMAAESLYSWMCGNMIFHCPQTQDAYAEIYPLIEEFGLERIVLETPSVFDDFMIVLEGKKQLLVFQSIIAFTYLFFLIVLMIYTSVLYYIHQAKDISVKLLNGYGFWSVFFYRMVFKVSVILLISVLSFFVKCNIIIALLIVLTELLIFSAVMRKMSMERITTVLKGD